MTTMRAMSVFRSGLAVLMLASGALAAPPAPTSLDATDAPGDNGTVVELRWTGEDAPGGWAVFRSRTDDELRRMRRDARVRAAAMAQAAALEGGASAEMARAAAEEAAAAFVGAAADEWMLVDRVDASVRAFTVDTLVPYTRYRFRVVALDADGAEGGASTAEATPTREWFFADRRWFAGILALLCATIVLCIVAAKRGSVMRVRRIAGLEAVEEAVGRATEMGRPILYVPGIQDMDNVQTIAGVTILNRVARSVAEYDAQLFVPTARSLVMTACREAVQAAYYGVGRPESFDQERIRYITDEQFGYTAFVAGYMVRERPATCIYMGQFYAESLLLAETGNSVGSIQIAGTAETSQLPFFVAACDYTLIGEELFAASAYLSGEVVQLGSLRGQDYGKAVVVVTLVVGVGLATLAALTGSEGLAAATDYLRETVLKG
jgi:hypothetical protein